MSLGLTAAQIPVDAVNTSGSNLDPGNLAGERLGSEAHRVARTCVIFP